MADIVMLAIAPEKVGDRPVINTGISMVGLGGDNFFCAHCGREIMHGFDIAKMQVEVAYQCGSCMGFNIKPLS